MTDADAHKDGIGPCFFHFTDGMKKDWWEKWKYIVSVTKFGGNYSEFCPLSPWNVSDDTYDCYKGTRPGSNSLDMLYFYDAS